MEFNYDEVEAEQEKQNETFEMRVDNFFEKD